MSGGRGAAERGNRLQSPSYAIQDLTRRINNMVRIGTVIDCDYPNRRVRVTMGAEGGEQITRWIKWMARRAAHDRKSQMPELYEQVVLLSMSGRLESAIIVGSLSRDLFPNTTDDPNHDLTLMRVLENSDYWFAKEERKFVGDVNPESVKANKQEQLKTNPPQDKVLDSTTETAEGLEYYYRNVIRPELVALMEHVAVVTQPNANTILKLVANSMNNGTANFLLEAGVKGDGDAIGNTKVISGATEYDEPTNPHKPTELNRTAGNAINNTNVEVVAGTGYAQDNTTVKSVDGNAESNKLVDATNGNALDDETIKATSGNAQKTVLIDGDNSELIITLKNTSHVRINIGESGQYLDFDGENGVLNIPQKITVNCTDAEVNATSTTVVNCPDNTVNGNMQVNGNIGCSQNISAAGDVSDGTRSMAADRDIYNGHAHAHGTPNTGTPLQKQ